MRTFLVDAFTAQRLAGNPAGVVLDADRLSAEQMQQIASEIHASETAFVSKPSSPEANFDVRFFTPTTEIAFCGHATVALFHTLAAHGYIAVGDNVRNYTERTNAGMVEVGVKKSNGGIEITMRQNQYQAERFDRAAEILKSLNLDDNAIDSRFPAMIVKTANRHLVLGLTEAGFAGIEPNSENLGLVLRRNDVVTLHAFAQAGATEFQARNFGPHIGIPEDPATGSAAASFGAYLHEIRYFGNGGFSVKIRQGEAIKRPGDILVNVFSTDGLFKSVEVAGTAVQSFELI